MARLVLSSLLLAALVIAGAACDNGNLVDQSCLTASDCASGLLCCGLPSGSTCQPSVPDGGGCPPS